MEWGQDGKTAVWTGDTVGVPAGALDTADTLWWKKGVRPAPCPPKTKKPVQVLIVKHNLDLTAKSSVKFRNMFEKEFKGLKITLVGCVKAKTPAGRERVDTLFYISGPELSYVIFALEKAAWGFRYWEDIFFNGREGEYPAGLLRAYPDPIPPGVRGRK
jgi:hypothetical protein